MEDLWAPTVEGCTVQKVMNDPPMIVLCCLLVGSCITGITNVMIHRYDICQCLLSSSRLCNVCPSQRSLSFRISRQTDKYTILHLELDGNCADVHDVVTCHSKDAIK